MSPSGSESIPWTAGSCVVLPGGGVPTSVPSGYSTQTVRSSGRVRRYAVTDDDVGVGLLLRR